MARVNISWEDKWKYECEGNHIMVRNRFDACELVINGKVQDAKNGLSLSTILTGKLPDGKSVKATVGGLWNMKCSVFVDHEMLECKDHDD